MARMPEFSFRLPDSTTIISTRNIPDNTPVVMIHFEADCSDCQQTTDSLLQVMDQFKNVRFYFLTMEPFNKVTIFKNYYHMDKYPNVVIGQDYDQIGYSFYKLRGTPLIALYDRKKNLAGIFKGKPISAQLNNAIKELQ
ncbi:hypothetical protein SIO70_26485 [Chitinophaga sancti]|uniref:TlpA family protein disulfide reductase n=1 Tax=Chitinophaga sancti TaxID=1004 RepID=UPI002A755AC8|nr:hypothetical protein [Chitinophaga sancti]WPQ61914.1 hypothetical protein SIO70_26485 [Chitinophaga sancti]